MQIFALPAISLSSSLRQLPTLQRKWELPCTETEDRTGLRLVFDISAVPTHSLTVCQAVGTLTISGLRPIPTGGRADAEIAYERFTERRPLPPGFQSIRPEITLTRDHLIVRLSR